MKITVLPSGRRPVKERRLPNGLYLGGIRGHRDVLFVKIGNEALVFGGQQSTLTHENSVFTLVEEHCSDTINAVPVTIAEVTLLKVGEL